MNSEDFGALIRFNLAHEATEDQNLAIVSWLDFMMSSDPDGVFLLKGYAGTGKTSLVAAIVRTLQDMGMRTCLLAPTGRAAKVFSLYAGRTAYTIHKRIYRQRAITDMDTFQMNVNLHPDTLFIVDEASMISAAPSMGANFGSGCLLEDLLQFVYSCHGCRLLLVGDSAQLPPVGEEESPALSRDVLEGYGMNVTEVSMTQVVRQSMESGILCNATLIRTMLLAGEVFAFPKLRLSGFSDVVTVPGDELIDCMEDSYRNCGRDGTIVVTRSNKRAVAFNGGVRSRIFCYEEPVCRGDMVMVARNNYFWLNVGHEGEGEKGASHPVEDFIANGDIARVERISNVREIYGFCFADATLVFPDYDGREVCATVLLDTLQSESPSLTQEQQQHLFQSVWDDYPEITSKRERMKALRKDALYNALQLKYAYAVTCHRAQGGQWQHVYVDQGYITEDMLSPEYYRWLYTALTRATEKVFLVNWKNG